VLASALGVVAAEIKPFPLLSTTITTTTESNALL